jgi:hypothetical protein
MFMVSFLLKREGIYITVFFLVVSFFLPFVAAFVCVYISPPAFIHTLLLEWIEVIRGVVHIESFFIFSLHGSVYKKCRFSMYF